MNFTSFFINSTRGVLSNKFRIFTGKHLCWSLFLIKLQSLTWSFIRKEALAQVFPCDFFEVFKSTFSTKHLRATASVVQWFSQHLEFHN